MIPISPIGQTSGSARRNRNTASKRNSSGQCFAHGARPLRCASAASPIAATSNPAQWWLYSDHSRSSRLRGGSMPLPGTKARTVGDSCSARLSSSRRACSAGIPSVACSGLVILGIAGVIRSTSSENVTRSWVKSTAGGIDVIDAAAISTAKPIPISTSTKRRTRGRAVPPAATRRTARKLAKPSSSNIPSRTLFVKAIAP